MGNTECPILPELESNLRWDEVDIKGSEKVNEDTQIIKVEKKNQRGIFDFYLSDGKCIYAGPFEKVMTLPDSWQRLGAIVGQKRLPDNNGQFDIYIKNSLYSSTPGWKIEVFGDDFIKVYDSSLKKFQLMGRNLKLLSDTLYTDIKKIPQETGLNPLYQVTQEGGALQYIGADGKIKK